MIKEMQFQTVCFQGCMYSCSVWALCKGDWSRRGVGWKWSSRCRIPCSGLASVYLNCRVCWWGAGVQGILKNSFTQGDTFLKFKQMHPMGLQGTCEVIFPTYCYWQRLKCFVMSIADEGVKKEAFSCIDLENFWNLNWGCFLGKQCGNVLKFFF